MLSSNHLKDRYCKFTYNSDTDSFDRNWIQYADGVFEPVRRDGTLARKWDGDQERCRWWTTCKPADWKPWEHGHGFSWNHDHGEKNKPAEWGNKSHGEIKAGRAPYFMDVELDADNRIESRTERIDGRR